LKRFENVIIASDIDGTYLWQFNYVSPRNLEALEWFKKEGGKFVFASGRNQFDLVNIIKDVENIVNAPCVLCNGSFLYDVQKDEIMEPLYLDPVEAKGILEYVWNEVDPDAGWRASCANGYTAILSDVRIRADLSSAGHSSKTTFYNLDNLVTEGLFKAVFVEDADKIRLIYEKVKDKFPKLVFTTSCDTLLEMNPIGVSKASTLKKLKRICEEKSGAKHTLCCVGDYFNDEEMLKCADISVCPENAHEKIKKICDRTVCHCKDGAIADCIEYLDKTL
jgi:Cof subfamily protein (haloacid dehalogenase superfamily)